ncbi:uncharacterized protein LOC6525425 [Drosophila yakuba]|uniref:Uncharacterized protein n=1 Tax=Drosophila yakuba TaxID=7245 RepID=B4Q113_DROYA|nr:uncharacterized protein LOC6525425 [Drosophila yakuba]EDX02368.1 uncharacterized protein Dyak_GE17522 [Drosophila yakuba]
MRFYILFFLALSCCLLHFSVAGVNLVRGLEAGGHHRNSTGAPPPRGAPPPPRTTTASSTG